jgi:hypothetical protein
MSYATDADLTTRVPASSAVALALRTVALADAEAMIDDDQFGDRTVRAHVMLAAHYLALLPGSGMTTGEGGLATSKSAGEISASYATLVPAGWDPLLATTLYGRMFLQILSTIVSYPEGDETT